MSLLRSFSRMYRNFTSRGNSINVDDRARFFEIIGDKMDEFLLYRSGYDAFDTLCGASFAY